MKTTLMQRMMHKNLSALTTHIQKEMSLQMRVPISVTISNDQMLGIAVLNSVGSMVGIQYGKVTYLGTDWFDEYKIKQIVRIDTGEVLYVRTTVHDESA